MPSWERKTVDEDELIDLIEDLGAATIKDMKTSFATDSWSVRKALGRIMAREDMNLCMQGGHGVTSWWFFWPDGKRGMPNPKEMRTASDRERKERLAEMDKKKKSKPKEPPPDDEDNWWE